ncbi:ergothioneine biosynthesis glutamate--cysteine ligase EgtA [Pseudonocardia hispaniensis]|uniref:ergothioneine biosynthesis glutamate--cysteine ligase EgtA n=1 Tax=Pseudonocardia hispaniensis TaxID=904933 RepID=UPI0036D41099
MPTFVPPPAAPPTITVLRSRAEAEAYVASVCFKHGPPRLAGVELEWLVYSTIAPRQPPDAATLAAALGPHTPTTLRPGSPAIPLPGGSIVTVEPGGQVELASPPLAGLSALDRTVEADAAELHRRLAAHGLRIEPRASDPIRPPIRILDVPRYRAMESAFDRIGPHGRSGMCSTAAVQVCLDAGEAADIPRRWDALHALGPVLLAAFANSPLLHGRRTGWKSSRMACWLAADPDRTAPPPPRTGDPAAAWAERVLHTPLLCVRRPTGSWEVPGRVTFADWIGGALPTLPTTADLDYHVSTLFPPVRPRGHLEVRYVDGQPGRHWKLPMAMLVALLSDPVVTDRTLELCEPAQGRWISAARHGLDDRVLAAAAIGVFELACTALRALGGPPEYLAELEDVTERRVRSGRCPADEEIPGEPATRENSAPTWPSVALRDGPPCPEPIPGEPDSPDGERR